MNLKSFNTFREFNARTLSGFLKSPLILVVEFTIFSFLSSESFAQGNADSEYRTFTDQEGQTIEARVVAFDGSLVTIQREDGQRFVVTPEIFSAKDQEYLKNWLLFFRLRQSNTFDVKFSSKFTNETPPQITGVIVRERSGGYAVELENRSQMDFEGLQIRYWLFSRDTTAGDASSDRRRDRMAYDRLRNIGISAGETYEFETKTILLRETRLQPGYRWASGAPSTTRDALRGLVIRLYFQDQLIHEWARPQVLSREVDDYLRRTVRR